MSQTWKKVVVGVVVEAAFCRWVAATKYKPKCNKNAYKKLIKSQSTTDWEKMLTLMLLQPISPTNCCNNKPSPDYVQF
jgi:hypothetical protein